MTSLSPRRQPSRCLCRLAIRLADLASRRSLLPDTSPGIDQVASAAADATLLALPFLPQSPSLRTGLSGSPVTSTRQYIYLPTYGTLLHPNRTVACPDLASRLPLPVSLEAGESTPLANGRVGKRESENGPARRKTQNAESENAKRRRGKRFVKTLSYIILLLNRSQIRAPDSPTLWANAL